MAKQNNTKVVTGIVRLSYANIWDPKAPYRPSVLREHLGPEGSRQRR